MKAALLHAWSGRGWLACLLWPIARLYGFALRLRLARYRSGALPSARLGVPVVVVGNVVAGGAGKTPLVMALVAHLQRQGLRVGVVSRGYGRSDTRCREVLADTPAQQAGDEPLLIRRKTGAPVFVAPARVEAARALLAAHPQTQVLICDDGLQHLALARDIEIVVFDDRGVGNGWLLPAGPLREPWPRAAALHDDLVLHTGQTPAFAGFASTRRLADHALAADGSRVALDSLRGRPVLALAAIASPQAFFAMLEARGLTPAQTFALPDHHDFTSYALPAAAGSTVLCTEKDAVKLFGLPAMAGFTVLAVPLEFVPEAAFLAALDRKLAPLLSPSPLPSSHGH